MSHPWTELAAPPLTVTSMLLPLAGDERPGLKFGDSSWSWAEHLELSARWAAWMSARRDPDRPFHVGVLLDNVPEFSFLLAGAALCGAVVVGINPTRRGAELARDVEHTDCQLIVTEDRHLPLLEEAGIDVGAGRLLVVPGDGSGTPDVEPIAEPSIPGEDDLFMLIFTSGTSGAPKAVRCTHRKIAGPGRNLAERFGLGRDDVCYLSMPLFHSNAMMAGWGPAVAAGATMAFARKFSASGFLPDVRRFGATYANYVGKPLAYVLATPPQPDDADNPLRVAFGNEGGNRDIVEFAERFGCTVVDGFGSTEGGVNVGRTPDAPPNSLGRPVPGVSIRHSTTMEECPPARFGAGGVLLNAEEAIGEIVNTDGAGAFEGYYRNDEANTERMRNGWYWSGDLAYADEDGFYYFAGRSLDWLRVDGENFAAGPIEALLMRHPDIVLTAVYAAPAPDVGDEVIAALLLRPGATFDPAGFAEFLGAQADLGAKWAPRFVRVVDALPQTATNKVLKRTLALERWAGEGTYWWRQGRELEYRPFDDAARAAHEAAFAKHGRAELLSR